MSAAVHHLGFAMHCRRDDMASTALQLERCLSDVGYWMSANRLKLNADKTELIWAGSRRCCLSLGNRGPKLQLGDDTIVPTNDAKVLGVTLSFDRSMDKHVSNVCSARFYRLRQLRRVRRSLDSGHGVGCNPRARLRHVPNRLLRCIVGWGTEGYN